jgi:hypothetical protein
MKTTTTKRATTSATPTALPIALLTTAIAFDQENEAETIRRELRIVFEYVQMLLTTDAVGDRAHNEHIELLAEQSFGLDQGRQSVLKWAAKNDDDTELWSFGNPVASAGFYLGLCLGFAVAGRDEKERACSFSRIKKSGAR